MNSSLSVEDSKKSQKATSYKDDRSGNTFRFKGDSFAHYMCYMGDEFEVKTNHSDLMIHDEGSRFAPVTVVETDFNPGKDYAGLTTMRHRNFNRFGIYGSENNVSINKQKGWEIVDFLEEVSVDRQTHRGIYCGIKEHSVKYSVPIVDWKLVEKAENYSATVGTLEWRGRKFERNPNTYYHLSNGSIVKSFANEFAKIPDDYTHTPFSIKVSNQRKGCSFQHAKIDNRLKWDKRTQSLVPDTYWSWWDKSTAFWIPETDEKPGDSMTLDFGKDTKVRYLSTMGRPPAHRQFPCYRYEPDSTRVQRDSSINLITDHNHEYVTQYSVDVRIDGGKEWVHIATYNGNSNCHQEVMHDIGTNLPDQFLFRFLRITPKKFRGGKAMRVMVYSHFTNVDEKANSCAETVEYTITYPQEENYTKDGGIYMYKSNRRGTGYREAQPRLELKKDCKQFLKEYSMNPDDFMEGGN